MNLFHLFFGKYRSILGKEGFILGKEGFILGKETNKFHIFLISLWKNFEKARFSTSLQNELFEKLSEPSRAELFDQKLEPKSELSEPSLGSGATLINRDLEGGVFFHDFSLSANFKEDV